MSSDTFGQIAFPKGSTDLYFHLPYFINFSSFSYSASIVKLSGCGRPSEKTFGLGDPSHSMPSFKEGPICLLCFSWCAVYSILFLIVRG